MNRTVIGKRRGQTALRDPAPSLMFYLREETPDRPRITRLPVYTTPSIEHQRSETPKVMGVGVSPHLSKVRQQSYPTTTGKASGVSLVLETGQKTTVSGWHPSKTAGGWPRHKISAPDNQLCLHASARTDQSPGRHTCLNS